MNQEEVTSHKDGKKTYQMPTASSSIKERDTMERDSRTRNSQKYHKSKSS